MLVNFKVLDLSYNVVNNSTMLKYIAIISSLKILRLQENDIQRYFDWTSKFT